MRPKQLRIGNYINLDYPVSEDSKLVIVDVFHINEISKGQDKFKPIPLTEEWLLKFGFVKTNDTEEPNEWYWKGPGMDLTDELKLSTSDRYYESMPVDNSISIKYLHQLQNLYFALTGEELKEA